MPGPDRLSTSAGPIITGFVAAADFVVHAADAVVRGRGPPRNQGRFVAGWDSSIRDTTMSTSEITLPPAVVTPSPRRRWPMGLVITGIVLVAIFIAASVITVPYDELVPGDALPVSKLITVPPGKAHRLHGTVLLTDVGLIENLHLIRLLPAWLDGDAQLVKTAVLTGNLPEAEENRQGVVDMAESQLTASSVALRQLGYAVPEHDVGATVYALQPKTPGYRALTVGDVITAVDGVPTPNPKVLRTVTRTHQPGQTITLRVGTIAHPSPGHDVTVRLTKIKEDGTTVPFIGILSMGTQPVYDFPFPIKIDADQIGGPSAGLAWTLGIINSLSGGRLTGGATIAASGTIDPDGSVGDVGGVTQKTVAVENAKATVFLVPQVELKVAQAKANAHLKVFGVTSLAQAMHDLESLGGHLGRAASGPPAGPGGHAVPFQWQMSPWS
jgi:PDZ domain-containing protein